MVKLFQTEVKEQAAEEGGQTEVDDDKKLTSILQRSVSEGSASSIASVGVDAKTRLENMIDAESVWGRRAGTETNGAENAGSSDLHHHHAALKHQLVLAELLFEIEGSVFRRSSSSGHKRMFPVHCL